MNENVIFKIIYTWDLQIMASNVQELTVEVTLNLYHNVNANAVKLLVVKGLNWIWISWQW